MLFIHIVMKNKNILMKGLIKMLREEERQAYLFIIEMIRQATYELKIDNDRSENKWHKKN